MQATTITIDPSVIKRINYRCVMLNFKVTKQYVD